MMLMPVIVPAYKRPDQLEKCREALKAQKSITAALTVHDNSEDNIGFTKAINRCLRMLMREDYPLALLLNQDCYLKPTALKAFGDFMQAHPRCAIVGAMQLHSQDEDIIVHAGCKQAYPNGVHIGGLVSRGECNEARQMPWVNGACMGVRMDALKEFGLLDEGMFLVGSDSDLCYTARLREWEVWYSPDIRCVHDFGESVTPTSKTVADIMRKDMAYWRDKWVGTTAFARLSRYE